MYVKRANPIQVAFSDPEIITGVVEVLETCLWGVGQVLNLFEPVFTHGAPPSPVREVLRAEAALDPKLRHLFGRGRAPTAN
jgi:hypothetical protein